ncbi:alpha/beta hydrolase [Microbacterium sp. SL75]|uniref:alpha/beta hydrolase n=1 Tax=Microbacterium sp. SL75 TaxID=2995140 RepID=UPI002D1E384F|nr:alpha/beta hydrolase [Microbacterium sp. SL75]
MAELGQTSDPMSLVPGSVGDVQAIVELCARRSRVARQAAETVGRKKNIDDWVGQSADAYTARVTQVATAWSDADEALARVGAAMRAYASALAGAQARAATAIEGWDYARSLQRTEQTAGAESPGFVEPFSGAWPLVFAGGADTSPPRTSAEAFATADSWLAEGRRWVADAARTATAAVAAATAVLRADSGSVWASASAALGSGPVTPATALSVLKSLRGDDLTSLLSARPDLAALLSQASPADVASWWSGLDGDQQEALVHAAPAVIGNLGGVAYRARDEANRIVLDQAIADAKRSPLDKSEQIAALEALKKSAQSHTLVSVVLDEPPLAQVAVGDLDAARNVSFIVPGMNSNVAGDMATYVDAAKQLQYAQRRAGGGELGDYAVIAWLGYHPPTNDMPVDVAFNGKAEAGAPALSKDLTSMAAVHEASGIPASVSVIAHSYGTNVAALALTDAHADHVVLLGSAGVDNQVDNVADLNVPPGQVFASQARHDGWAPVGQITSYVVLDGRVDPTATSFGAREFSSEAGIAPGGETLRAVDKHGPFGDGSETFSYFDANTTAQFNTALATTGRGDEVIVDKPLTESDLIGPHHSSGSNEYPVGWNGIR